IIDTRCVYSYSCSVVTGHLFLNSVSHQPSPTPFPYTTLFRSAVDAAVGVVNGHDALDQLSVLAGTCAGDIGCPFVVAGATDTERSEEHTSELQSLRHLVCRLLLEK